MERVRIGVLSFAHYHANFWSEAFRDDPRVDLVGIWDDAPDRAAAAGARFGTAVFTALDRLLEAVDAVAICSETAAHEDLIRRAAARGRHILCEKPVATTMTALAAIEAAVASADVRFMQSFPKRFDPVNRELLDLAASGALGRIHLARVRHGHAHGNEADFVRGWWADPTRSGGGTLIDEGVHGADFLRWLFGDPESVQATLSHAALGLDVEDTAVAVFRWADGLLGEVVTGWTMQAAAGSVELYGTEGTALLSGVDLASRGRSGPHLEVWTRETGRWTSSPTVPRFVRGGFHHESAIRFVDSLVAKEPPPIGLAEAGGALRMVLAAYRAAQRGEAVRLDSFDQPASS